LQDGDACASRLERLHIRAGQARRGGVGLRGEYLCQMRGKMLMYGPRRAGVEEMNLMKYFAGWNSDVRRKIG
jgi:hypothetical protein